ncbi:Transcriptional regulators [plant metagenome]|uniref:Transcriptional regulators n=1 Tax=plant metagenome TaxID=1297885 RepID=A0A484UAY1_9ZZZZ
METVPGQLDRFGDRLRARRARLSARMRLVADFIDQNRASAVSLSAIELAKEIGVSDATVIRTVQALGFEGLVELKATLASAMGERDIISIKMAATLGGVQQDAEHAMDYVIQEHRHALDHLDLPENRRAVARAVAVLGQAQRIAVFGIGASGLLADYAVRLFARNGKPAYALNRTGIALAEQLLEMAPGDALIVMVQQNIHREVAVTLQEAARLDVPVIVVTGQRRRALSSQCDEVIIVPRASAGDAPLHGPTLACLEMLMLGVAALTAESSLDSMARLVSLRKALRGGK